MNLETKDIEYIKAISLIALNIFFVFNVINKGNIIFDFIVLALVSAINISEIIGDN